VYQRTNLFELQKLLITLHAYVQPVCPYVLQTGDLGYILFSGLNTALSVSLIEDNVGSTSLQSEQYFKPET